MNKKEREEMERLQEQERKKIARNKANNEIIKNNFDRISCALPKGTKEKINKYGYTVNGLINELVTSWIQQQEEK